MVRAMAQDSLRGDAGRTPRGASAHPPVAEGWTVLSHLLSGFLLLGGIGWGIDLLLGTRWVLLVGLLLGGAASFALIYIRYLYVPPDTRPAQSPPRSGDTTGQQDRKETG
jgi:F0F1-type ATP synthase assembly protein I